MEDAHGAHGAHGGNQNPRADIATAIAAAVGHRLNDEAIHGDEVAADPMGLRDEQAEPAIPAQHLPVQDMEDASAQQRFDAESGDGTERRSTEGSPVAQDKAVSVPSAAPAAPTEQSEGAGSAAASFEDEVSASDPPMGEAPPSEERAMSSGDTPEDEDRNMDPSAAADDGIAIDPATLPSPSEGEEKVAEAEVEGEAFGSTTPAGEALDRQIPSSTAEQVVEGEGNKETSESLKSAADASAEKSNIYEVALEKHAEHGLCMNLGLSTESQVVVRGFRKAGGDAVGSAESCAQISEGDVIIAIDDEDVQSLPFERVVGKLTTIEPHVRIRFLRASVEKDDGLDTALELTQPLKLPDDLTRSGRSN